MSYQSRFTGSQIDDVIERCTGDNLEHLDQLGQYVSDIKSNKTSIQDLQSNVIKLQDYVKTLFPRIGGKIEYDTDAANNKIGGQIIKDVDCKYYEARDKALIKYENEPTSYAPIYSCAGSLGDISMGIQSSEPNVHKVVWRYLSNSDYNKKKTDNTYGDRSIELASITTKGQVFGAVWNDYAEFRKSNEYEPGRVVCEYGDGTLTRSKKRLQPGAEIISDTFGFAIGETHDCQTPIAVSGRVLAYPYENKNNYKPGDPVCAGPNGTISKMSRREVRKYPDRIIGTVSEIPNYDIWGEHNIKVNGRIWIRIR